MNKENQRGLAKQRIQGDKKIKANVAPVVLGEKKTPSSKEQYQLYMKYIVSTNSEYFQNKMKVNPTGKPRDAKLKIPARTGMSIYRRDYLRKQNKYNSVDGGVKHNMSVDCIKTNNFLKDQKIDVRLGEKTMYQSDFNNTPVRSELHRKIKKRIETVQSFDDDAPRFFQTQNKLDFLNWAGKNNICSMKPEERPAVTNAPLGGTSVYKSDFEGKMAPATPVYIRQASLTKFGCASTLMKTSYNDDYSLKKTGGGDIDCKPRYYEATLCKKFKGSTEYKRQFLTKQKEEDQKQTALTMEDLQTLIIDL